MLHWANSKFYRIKLYQLKSNYGNYLSYFLTINGEASLECESIRLHQMINTDQVEDGSVEPFGGEEKKYPFGYRESLDIYIDLCKNLKKGAHHVSLEGEKT